MQSRKSWRYWLANYATLGIYPRWVAKQASKKQTEVSAATFQSTDLAKLVNSLGGAKNINGLEYSQSRLKVFINDNRLVDAAEINKLPFVSGLFITSHAASLLVGHAARDLTKALELFLATKP